MPTNSNKSYFVTAGIAAAVGYLFFTRSGQQLVEKASRMRVNATGAAADKMDDARRFIERNSDQVTSKGRHLVDRAQESVEVGKRAYQVSGARYRSELQRLGDRNSETVANIHRAIDNMNRTVQTFQNKVLEPFCEMGAIVSAVEQGVQHFVRGAASDLKTSDAAIPFPLDQRVSNS